MHGKMLDWLTKFLNPADGDGPRHPHAFALAPVFGPELPARHAAGAVWRRFRACATIADDCQLGLMAWCAGTPRQVRIGSRTICRGLLHSLLQFIRMPTTRARWKPKFIKRSWSAALRQPFLG